MPKVIAQNRIPRVPIPRNRIAQPSLLAAAAGVGIGSVIMSSTPVTKPGYKRSDLCTEADIANVRAAGVLPTPPTFGFEKGGGVACGAMGMTTGSPTFTTAAPNGFMCSAFGDGWQVHVATDNTLAAVYIGYGASVRAQPILASITGSNPSIAYANGQFVLVTSGGIWTFSLANRSPSLGQNLTPTKVSNLWPLGGPMQLIFFKGVYVMWTISFSPNPIRYSTDGLVTWTACTVPALNANGSSQGGCITSIIVDRSGNFLIGVTSYGETLTSPDGITWTKTNTRAAGGTLFQLWQMSQSPVSGRLWAGSIGGTVDQIWTAPDPNTAWAQAAMPGVTATSQNIYSTAYQAGQLFVTYSATNVALVAVSSDDGASWTSAPSQNTEGSYLGGSGGSGMGFGQTAEGTLFYILGAGGAGLPPSFVRLDTDWAKLTSPLLNAPGTTYRSYVKVS